MTRKRKDPTRGRSGRAGNVERRAAKRDSGLVAHFGADGLAIVRLPNEPEWSADDRLWFLFNPNLNYRVRRTYPGEMEALGFDPSEDRCPEGSARFAVIGKLATTGTRMRRFARLEVDKFPLGDECAAHALFDTLAENDSGQRGRVTPLDTSELLARADAYANATTRKA
ncbi:MAG TPA: hypothetical protein VIG36_13430 [Methylocystis sp.]|jgi:hypothetical protein